MLHDLLFTRKLLTNWSQGKFAEAVLYNNGQAHQYKRLAAVTHRYNLLF